MLPKGMGTPINVAIEGAKFIWGKLLSVTASAWLSTRGPDAVQAPCWDLLVCLQVSTAAWVTLQAHTSHLIWPR